MRRLAVMLAGIGGFVFLTACGHGKARAAIPTAKPSISSVSKSDLEGIASYYAEPYNGRRTANGEVFDSYNAMTAAHKTLPFNTVVRVKNLANGEEVDVRINDRGPFIEGRVIDLSQLAAKQIDLVRAGVAPVKLEILKAGSEVTKPAMAPAAAPPPPQSPPPPPPPLPTPAAPSTVSTEAPVYGVQVGAFQSESAAQRLRDDLATRFSDVSIQPVAAEQILYRVRVGRAPDMNSAEQLAKKLRDENFSTFVVRLN